MDFTVSFIVGNPVVPKYSAPKIFPLSFSSNCQVSNPCLIHRDKKHLASAVYFTSITYETFSNVLNKKIMIRECCLIYFRYNNIVQIGYEKYCTRVIYAYSATIGQNIPSFDL